MTKVSARPQHDLPDFAALLKQAKTGDETALLEFLQCFRGLAVKLAHTSICQDRLGEDAMQIANLGLLKAVQDWQEGDDIHRIAAFVAHKMRTELHTAVRRQMVVDFRECDSNERTSLRQEEQNYHSFQLSEEVLRQLWLVRECLPLLARQQGNVIKGLLDGKTLKQLSFELGLDVRTVSLHRSRAIKKLRLLLGVKK